MAAARIFQRARNAMQSGNARTDEWLLEFESHRPQVADPLTGWSGGGDTQAQVTIAFPTLEAAQAYADKNGIACHLVPSPGRKLKLQAYADNFKWGRVIARSVATRQSSAASNPALDCFAVLAMTA